MQILFFPIMTITSMTTTTSMTSAVSCCEHKSNFIYVFNRKLRLTITAAVSASVSISASMTASVTFILRVYINYKTKFYKFLLPPYRCPASAANKTALMINNPKSKAITDFIFT